MNRMYDLDCESLHTISIGDISFTSCLQSLQVLEFAYLPALSLSCIQSSLVSVKTLKLHHLPLLYSIRIGESTFPACTELSLYDLPSFKKIEGPSSQSTLFGDLDTLVLDSRRNPTTIIL